MESTGPPHQRRSALPSTETVLADLDSSPDPYQDKVLASFIGEMNMSRLVTALAVLLCVPAARAGLKVGDEAPALKVAKWVKGKPVTLSEGKDKQIYVIEFWATWCPPCRQSIPHLTKIARHFDKSNVTIIGVSIDSEKTQAKV